MPNGIQVPRLAKGRGYKGPEFYGCFNTGMAPAVFHSRYDKYYVGPELYCHDAIRAGIGPVAKETSGCGFSRAAKPPSTRSWPSAARSYLKTKSSAEPPH